MSIKEDMLTSQLYCTLATVTSDGQPWSTPVFFANKSDSLYWFSSMRAQHSINIEKNSKVFISIFDSNVSEGQGEGLYLLCKAEQIPEIGIDEAIEVYNSKAKSFKVSRRDVIDKSPTRMYVARILKSWKNSDKQKDGYYEDIRKELK